MLGHFWSINLCRLAHCQEWKGVYWLQRPIHHKIKLWHSKDRSYKLGCASKKEHFVLIIMMRSFYDGSLQCQNFFVKRIHLRSRYYKAFFSVDFYATLELTNHISHETNCGSSDWLHTNMESNLTLKIVYRIASRSFLSFFLQLWVKKLNWPRGIEPAPANPDTASTTDPGEWASTESWSGFQPKDASGCGVGLDRLRVWSDPGLARAC